MGRAGAEAVNGAAAENAVVVVWGNSTDLEPVIAVRIAGVGDAASLTASVKFVNLPASGIAETEILGYSAEKDAQPVSLFTDVSRGDSAGTLSLSADGLSNLKDYRLLVIRTRVTSDGKVLYEGSRSIRR